MSKKEKAKQRPQALNTVEMLRVASSALGMFTASAASRITHSYPLGNETKERECFVM